MVLTLDVCADVALSGCVSAALASLLYSLGLLPFTVVFLTSWAIAAAVCILMASLYVSSAGKAVLITGCDSGFGFALAQHLDTLGFRVMAGCLALDGEGANQLRASASPRLHTIQLDVTSTDEVGRAVQEVEDLILEGEVLWAVVNNAGLSTFGEVEWVQEHTFRKILDVNVMGMVAVTKAFLPFIRQAKGRVVNMASMYGRMGNVMRGPYVLSKYAVEGFTDCLRQEMRPWGVAVSLIEPGNYVAATNILTNDNVRAHGEAMWAAMSQRLRHDYTQHYFATTIERMLGYTNGGYRNIGPVLEAITAAITHASPRTRYMPMDAVSYFKVFVNTHLPEYIYDHYCTTIPRSHPVAAASS
ncbi:D-beta-hydroxybutyrate dehydrogenase, mitochondrial [Chionoecetes opilio]|uniref:D-beta-hydroxybutyrate dehydrogenase, mitochondrial n=1 Tax=Chionoecetes opilio TaxID=41210 RepID=A0A8J5CZ91_CHIOP|nr:D-beta-hydroxybutyrate dehydrogenase, mitochondrial [Chionoecetes opilio]